MMDIKPAKPNPTLDELIKRAKERGPMTPAEIQQQRISFAFGNMPHKSEVTREEVEAADYALHGDLREVERLRARVGELEEDAERLAEFMLTIRDYVYDASTGALCYRGKSELKDMAGNDLVSIDETLAAHRALVAAQKDRAHDR